MKTPSPPLPRVAGHGLRVVRVDASGVLASRGSSLFRWRGRDRDWEEVFHCTAHGVWNGVLNRSRIWRRLCRSDVVSVCTATDGSTVCAGRKAILRAPPGNRALSLVFSISRGSRPLSITATGDGVLYWGEYFNNPDRQEVVIYGSRDGGVGWYPAYVFPPGTVRHVHHVVYDEERRRLWVLTGDADSESKLLWTDDHFSSLHIASEGSQGSRAVTAIPIPGGLLWGSDDPDGINRIRLFRDDGGVEDLADLEGPSFYAARSGGLVLVSTAVEPSRVNVSGHASLLVSRIGDLRNWRVLLRLRKDRWPMRLFQYGNIVLPEGPGDGINVWASGIGLAGEDGVVWRWPIDELERFLEVNTTQLPRAGSKRTDTARQPN